MLPPQSLLQTGARAKSWVVVRGAAGKTISVFLLGKREKKNLLEWNKRNERHAESQTWDKRITLSRSGNLEMFEGIRLIEEKETAKEYLSFNKLATDISLSSREPQSSLPTLFFCWDLFTAVSEPPWSFLFSPDFFATICN